MVSIYTKSTQFNISRNVWRLDIISVSGLADPEMEPKIFTVSEALVTTKWLFSLVLVTQIACASLTTVDIF